MIKLKDLIKEILDSDNPIDKVTMDIPLLIRLMEYAKEDAQTDMDLHAVAERLVAMSTQGQCLTMNDYNNIVQQNEETN